MYESMAWKPNFCSGKHFCKPLENCQYKGATMVLASLQTGMFWQVAAKA